MAEHPQYEAFYTENWRSLLGRISQRVDSRAVAEEIAQDAFHAVWQSWKGLKDPKSYLYRVAFNKANDELRKRRTSRAKSHYLRAAQPTERIYLNDALDQIDIRQKTAIFLKYYGDQTHNEVAEQMDIPTGTVKSLIHRGLGDLRTTIN